MKKFGGFLLILLLLFIGLTYWSVSVTGKNTKNTINYSNTGATYAMGKDSVLIAASNLYEGNFIKRLMQGENYRKAWSQPIKAPVVLLDTLQGGMEIVEEGGGKQTHSLRLQSPDGTLYSLRSINKEPDELIPEAAKNLGLENIIIDGISASHPYGAILSASLSDIAGVLHTHPKVYFIPKQEFLGKYNNDFGNKLYLLEYETEGPTNWTSYNKVKEILDTQHLQELKKEEGDDLKIDEAAFVRARLFDLLIGDWDRHAKQWGWVVQNKNGKYEAIPLAGDRDNAFFNADGIIPAILTNKHIKPLIRPYEKDIDYMKGLVYPVDVYFLRSTPEKVFVQQAKELQEVFTDEKIEKGLRVWPEQVAELDAEEIEEKLKSRRDKLVDYAREFYEILQKKEELKEPLKGSEDAEIDEELIRCFECG